MKRNVLLVVIVGLLFSSCGIKTTDEEKAIGGLPVLLADPTIFYQDGIYYLYGTIGGVSNFGFPVYISDDLSSWRIPEASADGYALKKGDVFGTKGFWAPEGQVYRGNVSGSWAVDSFWAPEVYERNGWELTLRDIYM